MKKTKFFFGLCRHFGVGRDRVKTKGLVPVCCDCSQMDLHCQWRPFTTVALMFGTLMYTIPFPPYCAGHAGKRKLRFFAYVCVFCVYLHFFASRFFEGSGCLSGMPCIVTLRKIRKQLV
jgi:hypothetical protein